LGLLFIVLLAGKIFQKNVAEKPPENSVKAVSIYGIGESPKATFQAKVEKSGVVKILAQAPGIIQDVSVKEGQSIGKGQQIISLSSNYQGGNVASVQRQIAQTQYQNTLDTFSTQKDLIHDQRNVATASAQSAQDMRDISHHSLDDTNSLINANQSQLDQMNQTLSALQAANGSGANNDQIAQLQASINQAQGGLNQLKSAQRSLDYQSANDKPPAQLAGFQQDIALKQLDVQEKSLEMGKEVSRLQLSLAYINEATMYPASPFSGTVERINVHVGQSVSPGTLLATIVSTDLKSTAVLNVPQRIAKIISQGEPSDLLINDRKFALVPYYVSSVATDGLLYAVFYDIPQDAQETLSDGEYISINVPVNTEQTNAADPLIPIDAVYQTQDTSFVLIAKNKKAETKLIKLGNVLGNYVEVLSGLQSGDQVILDRNVIAGDKIKVQ
jgi:RND family efflux transporter MFP subunit